MTRPRPRVPYETCLLLLLIASVLITDSSFLVFEPWSASPGDIGTAKGMKRKVEKGVGCFVVFEGK